MQKLGSLSYYDHFLSVIPNNLLQPFLAGNVLSVMLIAAAVGLALAFMPKTENRAALLKVLLGGQELLFTLIRALLWALPLGILAFSAQLSAQIEAGVIVGALGKYTAVVLGGVKALDRKTQCLADNTLDTALEAQKAWFLENSGLSVEE